jgi:hypothetical protein
MSRALLAVALSGRRTLAVTATGPGLLRGRSDLARDQVSRLQGFSPSGNPYLCAAGLEWNRGRCPPGFHPPQGLPLRGPPRNRRSSSALALRPDRLPCGCRPRLRPSVLPDPKVALSLSRLPTLSRFFPCTHPSLRESLRRWVIDSPRGRRSVAGPPAPLCAPPGSLPELDGFGLQGRIERP